MGNILKNSIISRALLICLLSIPIISSGQSTPDLFDSDEILEITISGNMKALMDDRGDDPQYHPFLMKYSDEIVGPDSMDIIVRTRGHFRKMKENCTYPPMYLNFSETEISPVSYFFGQDKLKLVTPCRDEKFVLREYLTYKIYNLVTDQSFRARLVRVVFDDTRKGRKTEPMYGVLLEDEDMLAERLNSISIKHEGYRPEVLDKDTFMRMAVFEYLIGNTDWSIQYLQNIKLIAKDTMTIPTPVPYDFDHAGIVSAPYAKPAEQLKMSSVRERRYRGYCIEDMGEFEDVFTFYRELKPDIYKIYTENPLLDEKSLKSILKFLDDFYETIDDPKKSKKDFTYPCLPGGTGNVVIRGLKN